MRSEKTQQNSRTELHHSDEILVLQSNNQAIIPVVMLGVVLGTVVISVVYGAPEMLELPAAVIAVLAVNTRSKHRL